MEQTLTEPEKRKIYQEEQKWFTSTTVGLFAVIGTLLPAVNPFTVILAVMFILIMALFTIWLVFTRHQAALNSASCENRNDWEFWESAIHAICDKKDSKGALYCIVIVGTTGFSSAIFIYSRFVEFTKGC